MNNDERLARTQFALERAAELMEQNDRDRAVHGPIDVDKVMRDRVTLLRDLGNIELAARFAAAWEEVEEARTALSSVTNSAEMEQLLERHECASEDFERVMAQSSAWLEKH